MLKYLSLHLLIPVLLLSCTSFNDRPNSSYDLHEVFLEDVDALLQKGSYLEALQESDYLFRNGRLSSAEFQRVKEAGITQIAEAFLSDFNNSNFQDAYRLYLSLRAVSAADRLPEFSEIDILLALAEQYKEKGESMTALLTYMKVLRNDSITQEQLEKILAFSRQSESPSAMMMTLERLRELNIKATLPFEEGQLKIPSSKEMMKGTATIWIDKGIKIEKGIGYPDRVLGSGFFIDRRGYLLTNYHVIESEVDPEYEGYSRLYIRLPGSNQEKIPAKVVGWDRIFDISLVKVELKPEFAFDPLEDVPVEPGQKVFAIGSPVDPFLENTITAGIISATGRRRLLQMGDVIQLDAPVNPGNSGGPLINEEGKLVGIVFAGLQPFEGLNFAIPFHWVNKILPGLFQGNKIVHSWLGMALEETEHGLRVIYTVPGEGAHKGGIQDGDIILSMDDRATKSIRDFQSFILDYPANSLLKLSWRRGDRTLEGLFLLSERPFSPIEMALQRDSKVNVLVPLFGMEIQEVGRFLWEKNYVVKKVIRGSIADNVGISASDPVNLQRWDVDEESRYVILQIYVKKKKAGFLESVLQLIAYMESDNFV